VERSCRKSRGGRTQDSSTTGPGIWRTEGLPALSLDANRPTLGSGIGDTPTMSALSRPALRWSALLGLWILVGAVLWIVLIQVFLLVMNPFCHLQRPGANQVMVKSVDRDPDSQITDYVTVKQDDEVQVLRMLKAEAVELKENDEVWILEAWYSDGLRPTQYRLTPHRLVLEYPVLLLLPAAWALWRLRKARQKAEAAPPPPIRRTFTDDFHLRAQRFAKPEATESEPGKDEKHPPMNTDKG
jgi:hypothetical protein